VRLESRPTQIDVPRVIDRDGLRFALLAQGFEVEPLDGDGRCGLAVEADEDDLLEALEEWLAESGAPLVPEPTSRTGYVLRPLAG
jgi:hypothetical protein